MKVERLGNGRYKINGSPVDNLGSFPETVKAVKKPIPIAARKINEPFTVETTEGTMTGKPGDWLIQGVLGEMYVCPGDVFDKSYDIVK